MTSPYEGIEAGEWLKKTEELVEAHPLKLSSLRESVTTCWGVLWQTKVGEGDLSFKLDEMDAPSSVVGYFFEKLLARDLASRFPAEWRGGLTKEDEDIVCLADPRFSVEVKTSGQSNTKIFGNRSYGQRAEDATASKPEKSGYYLTVNFYRRTLVLIRFGWIDFSDWRPQSAATGQAASLAPEVYKYKLIEIFGAYRRLAPVGVLGGVGAKTAELLAAEGILTIGDLLNYEGQNERLRKTRDEVKRQFGGEIP